MSTFRKHEAIAIAEAWLKDEPCRNTDEMYGEQRMAAMLLLAVSEAERLQAIVDKQVKALAACRRELLLYAGDPEDHDTGTAEALSLCEAAEQARKT